MSEPTAPSNIPESIILTITYSSEVTQIESNTSETLEILSQAVSLTFNIDPSTDIISFHIDSKEIPLHTKISDLITSFTLSQDTIIEVKTSPSPSIPNLTNENTEKNLTKNLNPNNLLNSLNSSNLTKNNSDPFSEENLKALSPLIKSFTSNPNSFKKLITSIPGFDSLAKKNPELKNILNSKEAMDQVKEAMSDPKKLKEMLSSHDIQMSNLMSTPGGEMKLNSLYKNLEKPMESMLNNFSNFGSRKKNDTAICWKELDEIFKRRFGDRKDFKFMSQVKMNMDKGFFFDGRYGGGYKKEVLLEEAKRKYGDVKSVFGNSLGVSGVCWNSCGKNKKFRFRLENENKMNEMKKLGFGDEEKKL